MIALLHSRASGAQEARVRRPSLGVIVVALSLLLWLVGTAIQIARAVAPAAPVQTAPPVSVEARLEPRSYVELALPQPARAEQLFVDDGSQVQAGQVLLRLDSYEQRLAAVTAAELDVLLAQQGLDELYRVWGVELAQGTLAWQQAEEQRLLARDRLASLRRSKDPQRLEQAYANLLLAEERLAERQKDLDKARRLFAKRSSLIWYFLSRAQFKQQIILIEKAVAYDEQRYWDAREKYEDLAEPLDPIDLAQAQAALTQAEARLAQAGRQRQDLLDGPDPEALEIAQARLDVAQSALDAAKAALKASEVVAPISGEVVALEIKPGEWSAAGQAVIVIADLSEWLLQTQDLDEKIAVRIAAGQQVPLYLEAFPEQALTGTVEAVSSYYEEIDGVIYYTARLAVNEVPAHAFWGMTARLNFGE